MKKKRSKPVFKKGLSEVISVMLVILLVILIVGIFWVVISSILSQNSQLAQFQSEFFSESMDFAKVQINPTDGLQVSMSLMTSSGALKVQAPNVTVQQSQFDIISANDLSGSMRECLSVNTTCCKNVLHGTVSSPDCVGIPASTNMSLCSQPQCKGTTIDSLTSAQNANIQLISTILADSNNQNRIGLVAYNNSVINQFSLNLTNSNSSLVSIVNAWQSNGSTCICCGINDARNRLASSPPDRLKTIIVMSDGDANQQCTQQNTKDAKNDSIKAACDAYANLSNLVIYSVGLGAEADQATMASIAESCGPGENFSAANINDLVQLYQTIAQKIISQSISLNKVNYLKIILYDNSSNYVIEKVNAPGPLQTMNYQFNLDGTGLSGSIVKIEVYPVIVTDSGKEVVGPLFTSWEKS